MAERSDDLPDPVRPTTTVSDPGARSRSTPTSKPRRGAAAAASAPSAASSPQQNAAWSMTTAPRATWGAWRAAWGAAGSVSSSSPPSRLDFISLRSRKESIRPSETWACMSAVMTQGRLTNEPRRISKRASEVNAVAAESCSPRSTVRVKNAATLVSVGVARMSVKTPTKSTWSDHSLESSASRSFAILAMKSPSKARSLMVRAAPRTSAMASRRPSLHFISWIWYFWMYGNVAALQMSMTTSSAMPPRTARPM
mmetsp:Transcript_32308/g.111216  ORF Transcript_32308/g.111216 Transcript_32308/m.111216 type:complete len:254 (+) Transcript_32308:2660-3421(+)